MKSLNGKLLSNVGRAWHGRRFDKKGERGFTLIELSIVLVIIGLIVAAILTGQDMIKAAEVRATVGQIEKYNSAVNTFRTKYNGIPGDLSSASATYFGFAVRAGTVGQGDNNGLIDGTVASPSWSQEAGLLYNDLSTANLIDGLFVGVDGATPEAIVTASMPTILPISKIAKGNYISAGALVGTNYWMLGGFTAMSTAGVYSVSANLTPIEAYNMDIKLDDGAPLTGIVQAHGVAGTSATLLSDPPTSAATSTPGTCLVGDTVGTDPADVYNRHIINGGNSPACILRFRFN